MAVFQQKKKALWLIGIAVFLLGAGVLWAHGSPAVSWEPESLDLTVARGASTTVEATVTAQRNIRNVIVKVVPALRHLVSVSPDSVGDLQAGQSAVVQVTLTAQDDAAIEELSGAIRLRRGDRPSRTYARPLKIQIAVEDESDPVDEIAGVDEDGNGIRDDVDAWIATVYPDKPKIQSALGQGARAIQVAITASPNKWAARQNRDEVARARDCLRIRLGHNLARDLESETRARTLNTYSRSKAYLEYDSYLGGGVFTVNLIPDLDSCDDYTDENGGN